MRLRNAFAAAISLALIAGLLVVASQAEGRVGSEATSNDGGAWLVDRDEGSITHIEHESRQPTLSPVVAASTNARIVVRQAPGVLAVHDQTAHQIVRIDPISAETTATVAVPEDADVVARPDGVVVIDAGGGRVWSIDDSNLTGTAVAEETPLFSHDDVVAAAVGTDGTVIAVAGSEAIWPAVGDGEPITVPLGNGFEPDHLTILNGRLVAVDGRTMVLADQEGSSVVPLSETLELTAIQAPADTWPLVAATTETGALVMIDVFTGEVSVLVGADEGLGVPTVPPIHHRGCVHLLVDAVDAATYGVQCGTGDYVADPESRGAIALDAELRLVNGFVWIDEHDGSGFTQTKREELEEIEDYSTFFEIEDETESPEGRDRSQLRTGNENDQLVPPDEQELDPEPKPPVALDDVAGGRQTRPALVDVLANDSDPNGDPLFIERVAVERGDAEATITPAGDAIQVVAPQDATEVQVRYWVGDGTPNHLTSAVLDLTFRPLSPDDNRPPEPTLDRVAGAFGSVVRADLLDNDVDPDGDAIQLVSVDVSAYEGLSAVSVHPDGEVILALPVTQTAGAAGTLDIPYEVRDENGEVAEGILKLTPRLKDANNTPTAANDSGVAQVGRRLTLNLLDNDSDPDNDALAIGEPAVLIEGPATGRGDFLSTSEDGEFSFQPSAPGTYVFRYSVSDKAASDSALIRVEVEADQENRAPVAIRDDVALSPGETRLVRVLDNDGDPDGDVLALLPVRNEGSQVKVVEEQGYGFWLTLEPGAPAVQTFLYQVSDGELESAPTEVIVTMSERAATNAPPIATDDSFRVRPGRISQLDVLINDFDPEGERLRVVEATSTSDEVDVRPSSEGGSLDVSVFAPDARNSFAVTYVVEDEQGQRGSATATVSMVGPDETNAPPVARTDEAVTVGLESVRIPVLANDSDPEVDPISLVAISTAPAGGIAELDLVNNEIIYTPTPGFRGTDQFAYLITDSEGADTTGSVNVGVIELPPENRPPQANPDDGFVFTADGSTRELRVLDNDVDPDGDPLTIVSVTGGLTSIREDGRRVFFTLPDNVDEEVRQGFTYQIADGRGGTDDTTVSVLLLPREIPQPPVANPDRAGPVAEGDTVSVNVRANDTDPDGDIAELVVTASGPGVSVANGNLQIVAPAETADFSYTITDADGLSAQSFVTVEVEPNLPPVVQSPIVIGEFNNDADIPTINLASYVTDPEGDELVFSNVAGQVGGVTQLDQGTLDARVVTFLPSPDYVGDGGFAFTVDDGNGNVASGRVVIRLIGPSNQPPVGQDQTVQVEAGVPQPLTLASLITDPDPNDTLTFTVTSPPGSGVTATGPANGVLTLDAPIDAVAANTSLTIEGRDEAGEVATSTVTVNLIESQVPPPQPQPDIGETNQGQPITVNVVANDIVTLPGGSLTLLSAGSTQGATTISGPNVTFTPSADFFGQATINYRITDGRTNGEADGTLTVNVIGRPSVPAALSATPLPPRSIGVNWQPPADNGAPITNYQVEVSGNGSTTVQSAGTSPSLTLNNLQPGVPYRFRVRAENSAGEGDWSPSTADVVVDVVPSPPGTPTVVSSNGAMQVSWSAAANEGSAISDYNVEISQCGSGIVSVGTALSHTWSGLTNGSVCAFRVTATNLAGTSQPSPFSALECPSAPPQAPPAPTAVRGDKQADISWSTPVNPDCQGLTGYVIRRSDGAETSTPAGTNAWTASPLQNGTSYSFQVAAINRVGQGPFSSSSNAVTPCGVPLAPPTPSAVRGDGSATVSFGAADGNGCTISQYQISTNGGGWSSFSSGSTVSGLTNGTSYTFRVRAINEIGIGDPSGSSNAVVPAGPPGAPSVSIGGGPWQVTWGDDNGSALTSGTVSGNGVSNNTYSSPTSGGTTVVPCINSLGNPCDLPATGSSCVQVAQTVSATASNANAIGTSASASASTSLQGCPTVTSVSANESCAENAVTVTYSAPGATSVTINNSAGGSTTRSGSSGTVVLSHNGGTGTVSVTGSNQFGSDSASTNITQTVIQCF